jgi:hypothetical protein
MVKCSTKKENKLVGATFEWNIIAPFEKREQKEATRKTGIH